MDQSSPRPSAVPRLSRLPIPRAGLHPAASRENLHQIARSHGSILNTHLRGAPTTLKFRTSTSALRRDIADPSADDVDGPNEPQGQWSANDNTALQRPSQPSTPAKGNVRSDIHGEETMREDGAYSDELESVLSRPRPSLSERTMETLQNIPSSPAVRRRNSSFFSAESPRNPSHSSRPASSYQLDGSMGPPARSTNSRPMSSSGPDSSIPLDFRASTNTFKTPQSTLSSHTPVKRPTSINPLKTPSSVRSSKSPVSATAKQPSPNFSSSLRQQSGSQIKSGSKTVSARSLKPRASVNSLIRKPSMPSLSEPNELDRIGYVKKKKSTTFSNTSSEGSSVFSRTSNLTAATAASDEQNEQNTTPRKSSLALRDQIAKAKAAKRAAAAKSMSQDGSERPVIPADTFDFGLSDDPFNQQIKTNGSNALLRKRVSAARTDGRLNIAAMGLKEIPEEVLTMYNLESIGAQDGSWAESVDLTRFVAADNDLEFISDDVFPDIDPRENANDEGNQFGGLETLDLHGNILTTLPLGLRRLELLTSLNLSNNKLNNDSLQIISKITSLRDLKIAGNKLTGVLHESIASLQNLESLDIQRNELTALPVGLAELVRLRVLNITENHFASLPFDILSQVPLIELFVAKNELSGVLIGDDVYELAQLQILDITANAVTSITNSAKLSLPALHRLSCSSNRLNSLPNMSSWVSLLTLLADDNSITSIPEGFITLPKLKSVDFSGNNIKELNNNIGGMHSLDIFRISGNPLRERKFSTMTTDDLKRALRARVTPEERVVDKDMDDGAFYSAQASPISPGPASSEWLVKLGNILDRSNTESHSLNPVIAAQIAANNTIRSLELHHNVFKEVPGSIAFFAASLTTLSLAHNELTSDTFLKDDLELPVLKELNLSSNTFNSVQPLIQHLKAPQLEKLDISFNRLTFLPALKSHFPNLLYLFASNNTLKELLPESIKGLRVVDCSSNDISSLNARIGLLGGPGGLERLDVSGNRFKVPKYTILEKGTEATLAWLRDRIPAGEPTSPTEIL